MGNCTHNLVSMAAKITILCIQRDPAQPSLSQENRYQLVTAVLNARAARPHGWRFRLQAPGDLPGAGEAHEQVDGQQPNPAQLEIDEKDAPFSPGTWGNIWDGTVQF
jgi:hypothetical protein